MTRGLNGATWRGPSPSESMTPGAELSRMMSARSSSGRTWSRPAGLWMSATTLRFPAATVSQYSDSPVS